MLTLIASVALVATFGFADRFTGGGFPKLDDRLPGRGLFWAALLAAGIGYLGFGLPGVALAVVWGVYRSLGFGRNVINPTTGDETRRAALRHALVVPPAVFVAVHYGLNVAVAAAAMTAYAAAAVILARRFGEELKAVASTGDQQRIAEVLDSYARVELARGAAFGAAAAVTLAS